MDRKATCGAATTVGPYGVFTALAGHAPVGGGSGRPELSRRRVAVTVMSDRPANSLPLVLCDAENALNADLGLTSIGVYDLVEQLALTIERVCKLVISNDPAICSGVPCVRGTRVFLELVLDLLPECSDEEIVEFYPTLPVHSVRLIRTLFEGEV